MRIRAPFTAAAALTLLAVLAACRPSSPAGGKVGGEGSDPSAWSRPPVVLVSIDTLRADRLPAYGYRAVETPHLDALREDSILFENAYTPVPLTLPAHASLLTGLRPPDHGLRDNVGYRLEDGIPTLPGLLGAEGYATGAAVSAYVLRRETGLAAGFDRYFDTLLARSQAPMAAVQRAGTETVAEAEGWIRQRLQAGEPFFFFLHLFEPHTPYEPPEPFASRYRRAYDGEVAAADQAVGRFLDLLRETGLYEPALIILVSDHGEGLGDHGEDEHGLLLYRETLRVPLMVKLPGRLRAGDSVSAPTGLVDVLPTVAEVVGLQLPPGLTSGLAGRSLLAPAAMARNLYSETYYPRIHLGWHELRSLAGERFHLIEGVRSELFDTIEDPRELHDVLAVQRRTFRTMEAELAAIDPRFQEPGTVTEEERAKLAALGYLSAPAAGPGPRPDPRDSLAVLDQLEWAFQLSVEGRLEEASVALSALLRAHPGLQDARIQRADVLRVLGRYEEAEAELREVVRRAPAMLPVVSLQLAEILLDAGDEAGAAEQARAGLAANAGRARLLLARAAMARGDLETARREALAALGESIPPEVPARMLLARIHLQEARHEAALEQLDRALATARKVEEGPLPGLSLLRGEALGRLGRLGEAEEAFEAEIAAFPGDEKAYVQLAFVYAAARRFDEIEPLFDRLAVTRPVAETFRTVAEALERMGNAEAARRWLRRAEERESERAAR